MKLLTIKRIQQDDCTIGIINFGNNRAYTLELPWKNNAKNISRIPSGRYICSVGYSEKNGDMISVHNVPQRTFIQIHKGNFTRDIEGCILVGDSIKDIDSDGLPDVTNSKNTLDKIISYVGESSFILDIL
ncbi:MAG: hypothetical protein Unbinned2480contig1002_47 [Prokaryotic dsDNA virus sp.]|nr:MAG: hypothetical protein Tp162SUR1511541_22 [Prokaryotic dsDNA virus sp.]QDP63793.1 MAG: hypothetical protein Unbinned2480contig1002_47 [Prokaryotic dsDNA virus sp.]QDP63862.1 MAG: hypothetical protein GOVbin2429_46 [Prokaryotic dsDNA virus sp.]|tara:strand:- start:15133 stop:15522 length:390 start_codon:yes stop_codon:yes gene_type:complete